jgi:hypothetical protein
MTWKTISIALAIGASALSVGTAALAGPDFLIYEGPDAVRQGQGGERKTVDGVDFWLSGNPPRKFQVLGSLVDRRHKTGIYGAIRMSGLDSDIAKAAKQAGGDAVILQEENDEVTGIADFRSANVYGTGGPTWYNGNGFSSGVARPIEAHNSSYLVIKYLPDNPTPGVPPQATPEASSVAANGKAAPAELKAKSAN